jgi:hypothetical protein
MRPGHWSSARSLRARTRPAPTSTSRRRAGVDAGRPQRVCHGWRHATSCWLGRGLRVR